MTDSEDPLVRFLSADDFGELRRLLHEHPGLLDDGTLARARQIGASSPDERSGRLVAERISLLRRCRDGGIDQAFRGTLSPE
jgi:hypothetical protein